MSYLNVFKNEDGEYKTYPDGDIATIKEIIEYEVNKNDSR